MKKQRPAYEKETREQLLLRVARMSEQHQATLNAFEAQMESQRESHRAEMRALHADHLARLESERAWKTKALGEVGRYRRMAQASQEVVKQQAAILHELASP